MVRKALVKGTIKISFVVVALATLGFLVFNYALPVLGDHTSTANLVPEWSPAGQNVDYTVTMSNDGPDTVDEVRIYKNTEYTGFECDEKEGWEMYFITVLQACFYVRNPDTIPAGESDDFTFSATVPSVGCSLQWKFETRDDDFVWKTIYDSTSVDDKEPIVTKTLGEPKIENEETWITQNTPITIGAYDVGDLGCAASGLDYCEYRYDVDGGEVLPWTRIEPEALPYTFYFKEDSVHFLEYRCFDKAGNMAYENETDKVDTESPETIKGFEGPQKIDENGVEWIDGVTQVVLKATDPEPDHASDVDKTWYLNVIDLSENACWDPAEYCNPTTVPSPYVDRAGCINSAQEYCDGNWEIDEYPSWEACVEDYAYGECQVDPLWKLYKDPFQKAEESCHVLQFFSIDNIGNIELMNTNCFFVDKTSPVLTKTIGEPEVEMLQDNVVLSQSGDGTSQFTDDDAYVGSKSVHLTAGLITDFPSNEGRIRIPLEGTTLGDIDTIAWYAKVVDGYIPHVDIKVDTNGDDVDDDALVVEYDKVQPPSDQLLGDMNFAIGIWVNTFDDKGIVDDSAGMWLSSGAPGPVGDSAFIYGTLQEWKDGLVDSSIDSSTKVVALEIEVDGWIADAESYVDFVKLNGEDVLSVHSVGPGTPVTFTCTDPEPHPSDDEKVCFKVSFDKEPFDLTSLYAAKYQTSVGQDGFACVPVGGDPGPLCSGEGCDDNQFIFNFNEEEDSLHDLEYYCKDAVEKKSETEIQWYKVDSVPPVITKEIVGSQYGDCPPQPEGGKCYIQDSRTIIRVDVEDNAGAHDSGVDYCTWSYTVDDRQVDESIYEDEFPFNIVFPEDSTHVLTIECFDKLGNKRTDVETFEVDSIPPVTTKNYGEPYVFGSGPEEWITSATPITLIAEDEKVGVDKIYWRNTLLESDEPCQNVELCEEAVGSGEFNEYAGPFYKPEESCHLIEYYSVDLLRNEEKVKKQCVFVDNTTPIARADTGNPKIRCPEDDTTGCDYWIRDQVTSISLSCRQAGEHPSPLDKIQWRWNVDGGDWKGWFEAPASEGARVVFEEESVHTLEYTCNDTLGNQDDVKTKIYKVDSSPPIITKEIIGPQIECIEYEGELDCIQIDGVTNITVDAFDPEPHPVNDVTCDWSYKVIDNDASGGEEEVTPPFVIQFPEESTHDLIITCRDALGNEASDEEIFIVDKTPPETTKTYNGPQYSEQGYPEWITSDTDVILEATDTIGPHDSGVKSIYWRNTLLESDEPCLNTELCEEAEGSGDFQLYTDPFNKPEESCHLIEYYSVDNVDKIEKVKKQCVFVDNKPPVTTKEITGPQYEKDGKKYIDGITEIKLTCRDPEPHPVNQEVIWWRYNVDDGEPTSWQEYTEPIVFPEESKHTLEYYCADALGNKEETQTQVYYVDKTPPETTKGFEGFYNITKGIEWINTDTLIHLDASDNKAGVKETWYRNTLVDDGYCLEREECGDAEGEGEFQLYTDPFNKPEESCHLIEYYSIDNVDKTEEVNRQCVFVDDSLPTPNKTVGEPKAECSEGDWCDWKITTLTPVKLDCSDTHIVGEQEVCYRIFLDGELQGDWNCVGTPQMIYFKEESNHTLEYYCKDLVQTGAIDSENFKVEGTAFTIHLNKKWNLISVPFVMLNNSMDEAFKDIGADISSVWTYDAETDQWYVYTPDNGPDTLTEMKPGWGYWVLAKNDTLLVIGGSLFSPATTPPSRDLLEGWNLIGYYGTEDMLTYDGPDGNGDSADCALNSLGSSIWDKEFTSLWTYWELYNPNQWIPYNKWNNMDPGAGYWVSIPEDGLYTPSTTCSD